jgi:hypothetical protein
MIVLDFERQPVRLLVFEHQIWCPIDDLASVLGEPVASLLNQLNDDEQTELPIDNSQCDVVWVNEGGIYALTHSLNHSLVQRWKQWWLQEVLPCVRGSFSPSNPTITAKEALDLAIPVLRELEVSSERLGTWILSQYRRIYPAHADIFVDLRATHLEDTQSPTTTVTPLATEPNPKVVSTSLRLSPTELGQLIAQKYRLGFTPSPQKINQALARLDLQILAPVRNGKEWKLTKVGNNYGRLESCVDRHNKNRIQIRWSPEVAPLVAQELGLI